MQAFQTLQIMNEKIKAVRRIQFCAGHRVFQHESKCANMHGHNYVAFFHAEADDLDSIGRVIDFSVLKAKLGTWIDVNWDHGFLYYANDEAVRAIMQSNPNHKSFCLPYNPTAENMAKFLLNEVCPPLLAGTGVVVKKIVLWETENCFVEVERE